jgi:hypothetical protein
MKTKNIITVVLLLLIGSFSSCEKKEQVQQGCINEWCFEIENSSKYRYAVEVKLTIYDVNTRSTIEIVCGDWGDGGFTIALPKTLDSNYLHPLIHGDDWWTTLYYIVPSIVIDMLSTITISNENVKVRHAEFMGIHKDGYWGDIFYPVKIIDEDNYTRAIFTYVDSDVTISGFTSTRNDFGNPPFEIHRTYSVEWKKGWNVWYFSKSRTITGDGQWSSIPVDGLKWYGREPVWLL